MMLLAIAIGLFIRFLFYARNLVDARQSGPLQARMLITVRTSQVGSLTYLQGNDESRRNMAENIDKEWALLLEEVIHHAEYIEGIHNLKVGFVASTPYPWKAAVMYGLENQEAFNLCSDLLRKPVYATLKNALDIDFILGNPLPDQNSKLNLF